MTQGNSLIGKFHLNEKRRLSQDKVCMRQTHPVNEGLKDYTSVFAEKSASMTRYTGFLPDNASSGLKHWRIHEHVSRPFVDWTMKGGCASEVSGAV